MKRKKVVLFGVPLGKRPSASECTICPACLKPVTAEHFSCASGSLGGSHKGASKVRGDRSYYSRLAKMRKIMKGASK